MQVDDCSTCKYKTDRGDCSRRTWGDDGYLHFPEDGCYEADCNRLKAHQAHQAQQTLFSPEYQAPEQASMLDEM